jgi:RNA polymerase sigma factor (sigma-70 family)
MGPPASPARAPEPRVDTLPSLLFRVRRRVRSSDWLETAAASLEWLDMSFQDDPSQVIQRCLDGDPKAWVALVDRYSGLVYAVARAHRLDEATCDDVAQTAFGALFRNLGSIRDTSQLAAWLSQTTRRECWRLMRGKTVSGINPGTAHEPVYLEDEHLEQLERRDALRAAFEALDPRCQTLLRTLFADPQDSSYERISERLAIPVGSIGPTRRRCLAKLRVLAGAGSGADDGGAAEVPKGSP